MSKELSSIEKLWKNSFFLEQHEVLQAKAEDNKLIRQCTYSMFLLLLWEVLNTANNLNFQILKVMNTVTFHVFMGCSLLTLVMNFFLHFLNVYSNQSQN